MNVGESSTPIPVTIQSAVALSLETIPDYDGSTEVKEFLERVEQTAILGNWDESKRTIIARLKLKGEAHKFVQSEPYLRETSTTWDVFKKALSKRFKKLKLPGQVIQEFHDCKQRVSESVREYVARLRTAGHKTVELGSDEQKNAWARDQLKEGMKTQFMLGLRMPLQQRVLSAHPKTFDEAIEMAEREEIVERMTQRVSNLSVKAVNGWQGPRYEARGDDRYAGSSPWQARGSERGHGTYNPNAARNARFRQMNQFGQRGMTEAMRCYYCSEDGHVMYHCPKVMCQNCQKRGHLSKNCTENLNGNGAVVRPAAAANRRNQ